MIEGELRTINRALAFQKQAGVTEVPVSLEKYLAATNAELRVSEKLRDDEAGQVITFDDRSIIVVNARNSPERQRFTVLHEIAHLVLELPSEHRASLTTDALLRYRGRPREEILCDIFASECLLPRQLFIPNARSRPCTMRSVQELAERYEASLTATGSRFAACHDEPCAWVLADEQCVRYVSMSPSLREAGFYVQIGTALPRKSVLGRLAAAELPDTTATDVVPSYVWTNRPCKDIEEFAEEASLIPSLSQGVALLCAEERDPGTAREDESSEGDERLRALDGVLRFPKR